MGLQSDKLQRLKDAIASWRQKIEDEKQAAIESAEQSRRDAEDAAALAAKTKAETDTATHLSELNTLHTSIESLVSSIIAEDSTIVSAVSSANSATTSSAASTQRDIIITSSANITRYINDIGVKKASLEVAYNNLKKSTDDYDSLSDELATGRGYYNHAIADIDSIADSKKDAESAVSTAVNKVSTLIASEAAEASAAAQAAAIAAAEAARAAEAKARAEAGVAKYLAEVQSIASDISTIVSSLDASSASIASDKITAGNATASSTAISARDAIATESAEITVLINSLGAKSAALEVSYGNLVSSAGTYSDLQDDLALGTTEYNDAQDEIQSVSTAKKDAETQLAYASNIAASLLASEAAAQAAADSAAAQAAAELEAQQQAAAAQAAAEATAATYKSEAMAYTDTKVAALVDSAPGTLNTLNELAAALGDDPNYATTVASQIGALDTAKVDKINITGKTVGSTTAIPVITYNTQGQITSASTVGITVGNGTQTITAGAGISGGGSFTANQTGNSSVTISHADTSSVTNIDTDGKVIIDALTFDTYGHVTGATSRTLDYYTTGEADARYVNVTGDTMTGTLNLAGGLNVVANPLRFQRSGTGQTGQDDNVSITVGDSDITFTHNNDDDGDASQYNFRYMVGGVATDILAFNASNIQYKGQNIFHDGYHPNADKWTSARTLSLSGAVTGSATIDGSGNVDIATTHTADPVITLTGAVTGSGTMTNLGSVSIATTATADPTLTLTGDVTGSATFTNLGNATLTATVADNSHNHTSANISDATNANTANMIVKRDASGNFSAGTITATLSGNASTASSAAKWTTARTLTLTGDATGSVSWDGSGNASISVAVGDADTLDGQHGSYYNHRNYTDASTYLGGYYVSGGSEKPNNTIFGSGKLKIAMLSGSNLGFGGSWNDVLWMSTYTGADVKPSWAIVGDKYSDNIYIARQNYDSTSWGTGHKLWHSGNDGSGSGLDADTLDGLHSSSFAASSHSHSYVSEGGTSFSGTYPVTVRVGANNFYSNANITFNGTTNGLSVGGRVDAPIFYDSNDTSYYVNPNSLSVFNQINMWGRLAVDNPLDYASSAVTSLTSAPLSSYALYDPSVDTTSQFLPMTHQTATYSSGYRTHCSTGLYKYASGWGDNNTGWYAALGGSDSYPTMYWKLTYGTELYNSNGYVTQSGSFRAPIFYDSNNTGYYIDPASTSVVNAVKFFGDFYHDTSNRDNGMYGSYDSTKTDHIWSMGTSYRNNSAGTNFGNLYGLAYKHTNNTTGGTMASGHMMVWCQNGTGYCALGSNIWTSGNVTAYSDIRVKTNIERIPNALEKVKKLGGYTFDRTDVQVDQNGDDIGVRRQTGVIAQEVLEVLPEAVTGNEETHYSVAYGNMVGLLIEAIKEQDQKIESQASEIEQLKTMINTLVDKVNKLID